MAEELIYTSAERGLRPGTRGFCTVAYTQGMPPGSVKILESLSAYKNLYPVHDARAAMNPVAYSHSRFTLRGRNVNIISRIGPAVADHTNRSNKIAHHVVLSKRERCDGGPAWLCLQDGFFRHGWHGPPQRIPEPRTIPAGDTASTFAAEWEQRTGDAGWAGAVANAFLTRPSVPVFIIFEPGMEMLSLVAEALALVPVEQRWQVTFSTYFSTLATGTTCCWRCCVAGPDAARESRRNPRALTVDLSAPLGVPSDSVLVRCARDGTPLPPSPKRARDNEARVSDVHDSPVRDADTSVRESAPRTAFTVLPNRNRDRLHMRPGKREDPRSNDTGRATGPTDP